MTTPAPKPKLRVAAYCRVSTDKDAQAESLEAQVSHYEQAIAKNPEWELAEIYYDEGITGTKKEVRPELMRLLSDCENGKIDVIITKSISRLARNTADCLEMVRRLKALSIPVIFESENINTSSMESELLLSILSGMAEAEARSTSDNSKWAVRQRFKDGTYRYSTPAYGYVKRGDTVVPDPEKAEIVKWIFAQVISGDGSHVVAGKLNKRGVPTKKGGKWASTTVLGMVRNEAYTGSVLCQKTYTDHSYRRHHNHEELAQHLIEGHHEPIISREVFEAANEAVDSRARKKGIVKEYTPDAVTPVYHKRHCFSGRIICGECGGGFRRRTHVGYAAWCCGTHITDIRRCSMKFIRDDSIKTAFCAMINKLIYAPGRVLKTYLKATGTSFPAMPRIMLEKFDEELFEKTVTRITVISRTEIAFDLVCGLSLIETLGSVPVNGVTYRGRPIPRSFTSPKFIDHYDDPKVQAEYVYSLIKERPCQQ